MMPAVTYYRTTLCPNASYKITAGAVATFSKSIVRKSSHNLDRGFGATLEHSFS
jgi:hypothetical protein